MIKYSAVTDIGLHRENNQDSYLTVINNYGDFLALVCDGIGGAKAGDVASGKVSSYFDNEFKKAKAFTSLEDAKNFIIKHISIVNKEIHDLSVKYKKFEGMGTTVTGLLITKYGVLSINIGDSRVYGFLDDKLFRLTNDHTLVNEMLEKGEITYEISLIHPKRHYLTRAVGVWKDVECDVHEVKKMDYYLLCSDGLCGYISDNDILNIIINNNDFPTCEDKTKKLLEKTLMEGGPDNITVVVVSSDEDC